METVMRNIAKWKDALRKQLVDQTRMSRRDVDQLLDVELGLFLIKKVTKQESAAVIPALLSGHELAVLSEKELGLAGRRMLAVGRYLLRYYRGSERWGDSLRWYQGVSQRFRLYDIRGEESPAVRRPTSICPRREDVYLEALSTPPPHIERVVKYADSDRAWHFLNGEGYRDGWDSVHFPEELVQLASSKKRSGQGIRSRTHRDRLRIPWEALLETATWMDERSSPSSEWRVRIESMRIELLQDGDNDALVVDGSFHLAGMVSSGKSTLMDVIAVWAARNGLRITLIVGDVVDAVTRATLFWNLGLRSVPLLGASNRRRHFERILSVAMEERAGKGRLPEDSRLQWVSPICLLDGLSSGGKVISPGEEPCYELYEERGERKRRVQCPLMNICPVHRASNDLMDSHIWVATTASLLYTRSPVQATHKSIRLLELVYRDSDLVIVDEVDRVQVQLDSAFGPNESLIGETGEGWMDQLEISSSAHQGRSRSGYLDMDTNTWSQAQRLAQQAADLIITLVNDDDSLKDWITRQTYFTGHSLFQRLLSDDSLWRIDDQARASASPAARQLPDEVDEFLADPFSRQSPLSEIGMRSMLEYPSDLLDGMAANWIKTQSEHWEPREGDNARLIGKLFLAVATAILDHRLKKIVDRWDSAEEAFGLSSDGDTMFQRPPSDYRALVPEAAMGNLFGFRYTSSEQRSSGGLQFFRCAGIGRWILLHMHDLFEALDGIKGPHTIFMSGTSWAPGSMSHHLQLPVDALLKPPENQTEVIRRSRCFFSPISNRNGDVVNVSGARVDMRDENLKTIVHSLASPGSAFGLQAELELLPEDRQRILLVVQSYRQAETVASELNSLPNWTGKVVQLVRDDDEERRRSTPVLRRGRVYSLAERRECVLVAPLLALERGHNILINDGRAAVGSVFFLVRPMPVPFEMSTVLGEMNWWAMNRSLCNGNILDSNTGMLEEWRKLRREANIEWHTRLHKSGFYTTLTNLEITHLAWTQLIAIWQTVGRTVRGGSETRVHFCDAAFAPETARGESKDSRQTSLLVAMRSELDRYLNPESAARDPRAHSVANALYGPWASALKHIEGLD